MWVWYLNIVWAYITSHSCGGFASRDLLYPLSTFLSASGPHTAVVHQSLDDHALVYVPRAPSFELSDELDDAHVMIAVLLPAVGIEPTLQYQRTFLWRQSYTTWVSKYLLNWISTSIPGWYKAVVVRMSFGTVTWVQFPPPVKGLRSCRYARVLKWPRIWPGRAYSIWRNCQGCDGWWGKLGGRWHWGDSWHQPTQRAEYGSNYSEMYTFDECGNGITFHNHDGSGTMGCKCGNSDFIPLTAGRAPLGTTSFRW